MNYLMVESADDEIDCEKIRRQKNWSGAVSTKNRSAPIRGVVAGLVAACLIVALPVRADASPVSLVNIGGRHYVTGNVATLANRLVRTTDLSIVLLALERCRGLQGRVFVSTSGQGIGLTAYGPLNLAGCVQTPNGGPGGGVGGPCLQSFRTPEYPDPVGAAGLPGGEPRYFVAFAGTRATVCEDISTQVPGGVYARTTATIPGLPAGSVLPVKCQFTAANGLFDYLAPPAKSLPSSKATYLINDYYFETGVTGALEGVPACFGVSLR